MTVLNLNLAETALVDRRAPRARVLPAALTDFLAETAQVLEGALVSTGGAAPELSPSLRRDLGLD